MTKPKKPTSAIALPPPPEHLNDAAKEIWQRTVALLARMTKFTTGENVLTTADLDKLQLYCVAFANWQEAVKHSNESGLVIREGGAHKPNPFVAIQQTSARAVRATNNAK